MAGRSDTYNRPAIAGSGAIASGLAATACQVGEVVLIARSDASARRAEEAATAACGKLEEADPARLTVTTEESDLAGCDLIVESVVEDLDVKSDLLARLGEVAPNADLATTTSSLSIGEIAARSGTEGRLFGLHVFNPVPKMELIEVCFPEDSQEGLRERGMQWCSGIGKTAVEVPDRAGFVVNRLLFPYLFDAVRLLERTGMDPAEVDTCMTLGAGHPMGPLRLLDFIGLDVAEAIGEALFAESGDESHRAPASVREKISAGRLGRKSAAGFYDYD